MGGDGQYQDKEVAVDGKKYQNEQHRQGRGTGSVCTCVCVCVERGRGVKFG